MQSQADTSQQGEYLWPFMSMVFLETQHANVQKDSLQCAI